jgi:YjjG family noncanonical pyrimidine nucleotidase
MKSYRCILFDLDDTLWDHDANACETLGELFSRFRLAEYDVSLNFLIETFRRVNRDLWDRYDRGLIGQDVIRNERFARVFYECGIDDNSRVPEFSVTYLQELPQKKNLLPQAREVLEYLHTRYAMTIVTNGFEEVQSKKIESAGINHFFRYVVTSQRAGSKKPSAEIFQFALQHSGHSASEAVMIGDNLLTDMAGAMAAGVDTIYYNPKGTTHQARVVHEIKGLGELLTLL